MIEVRRYQREDGGVPVRDWLGSLRDVRARAQMEIRLRRLAAGNFGDCKPVGEGVLELRVDVGAGYRLHCARHGQAIVILLNGVDKRTQDADIKQAKGYWIDWKRRNA